jgi:hypothetical protein
MVFFLNTYNMNNRYHNNREILKCISDMVEKEPELRFNQILYILGISVSDPEFTSDGRPTGNMVGKDLFNEESNKTLKRINLKK